MGLRHGGPSAADFATSAAPADVVRRQYLASAAGDLEALRATLAPDAPPGRAIIEFTQFWEPATNVLRHTLPT